uniref:Putative Nucleotide-binding, alpha-beta plait n=1 Tax=Davidia involucrata TaxID=16924 RepID=A0A5B6ZWR2_DAVIN
MSRKRDKPYISRHVPYSLPKRRRPLPPPRHDAAADVLPESSSSKPPTTVIVIGVSPDCSVLDLKSRFEIYGCISRTRMDPGGVAYVTFRSKDSAESAIAASLDPSFGITLDSQKLQVMWANDSIPQWREGVRDKDNPSSSSKLLKAEVPLSRHGRGNRLGSAIVNPRNNNSDSGLDVPFKGREIVAYDDIL